VLNATLKHGPSGSAYLELSFSPSLEFVSLVRRLVAAVTEQVLTDPDLVSRIGLAAHELLENAVKYSVDGEATIFLEVAGADQPQAVAVRTRNRGATDHVSCLAKNIDEIATADDPVAFFQQLMVRSVRSGKPGGLGLGRIAAEAEMVLSCVRTGDIVEVEARTGDAR
jgi:anti-sigma regulatory factor (Ser/Thr protein kinase)